MVIQVRADRTAPGSTPVSIEQESKATVGKASQKQDS